MDEKETFDYNHTTSSEDLTTVDFNSRISKDECSNASKNSEIFSDVSDNLKFCKLNDIVQSIPEFNGDQNVIIWTDEFEEYSNIFCLTDLQKIIVAKKLLIGKAKLFVQTEKGISTNWLKLKQALIDEFSRVINSAELHELLTKRKLQKNETTYEYYLNMREIASRGQVDEESIIQYIIDGIEDRIENKYVLYEAKTLAGLKKKLLIYDKIRERSNIDKGKENEKKQDVVSENKENSEMKSNLETCSNCGSKEHQLSNCPTDKKNSSNNNGTSNNTNVTLASLLNNMTSDTLAQLTSTLLPTYTMDTKDIKDRLRNAEEKITNLKIEVERLIHETSRQNITIGNQNRKIQELETTANTAILAQTKLETAVGNLERENKHYSEQIFNLEKRFNETKNEITNDERGKKQFSTNDFIHFFDQNVRINTPASTSESATGAMRKKSKLQFKTKPDGDNISSDDGA